VKGGVLLEIVAEVLYGISQEGVNIVQSVVLLGKPPTNSVKFFFFKF